MTALALQRGLGDLLLELAPPQEVVAVLLEGAGHPVLDAVRDALLRECGTDRPARSIESQASRCHVSLRVRQVCPECGVVDVRLNGQSGLCPRCTELMHLAEEVADMPAKLKLAYALVDQIVKMPRLLACALMTLVLLVLIGM